MSRENVEIIRQANEAFNAHDLERWVSYFDPDVQLVDHQGAVAEESASGIDEVRRVAEGWVEAFPDFRMETSQFIDTGSRVVCVTHWQGAGAGSGLPFSTHAAEIFEVRNGEIVNAELGFTDKAAALEAVELRE